MTDIADGKAVVRTVFIALVLDLLAFTMPLPLFPRLIAWYLERETTHSSFSDSGGGPSPTLLSRLLDVSHAWRAYLLSWSNSHASAASISRLGQGKNWDVVLLGGAMGSLFSFCQCIISPWLGGLSDTYGRKKVLLITMLGNILSAIVWLRSTTFSSYLLSRVIGGLSEGNVQLSTAIISDVTTSSTRSRSLALVGIAFSVCFTLGPSLGAYFASRPLPLASSSSHPSSKQGNWNVFALPAAISLGLLAFETVYLFFRLPETRNWVKDKKKEDDQASTTATASAEKSSTRLGPTERLARLRWISRAHGLFLLFFSGAEFTLTFLTYDLFNYSNAQNGRLLSFIGILSAFLQARHVRPSMARTGELRLASYGILSCLTALALLAVLPLTLTPNAGLTSTPTSTSTSTIVLYAASTCLAYTSATVVSCLTAAAAAQCDEETQTNTGDKSKSEDQDKDARLKRGAALGRYRSAGQLGRAIGPILASSTYWLAGPTVAYTALSTCLVGVWWYVRNLPREKAKTL